MEDKFKYIVDLATQYQNYSENPQLLLDALNNLPQEELTSIYREYSDPDREFKPVNFLRVEVLRRLRDGESLTIEAVEKIKTDIRDKNIDAFERVEEVHQRGLQNYKMTDRDLFQSWSNLWSIFYPFIYRNGINRVKENVQNYLDSIAEQLISDLGLKSYQHHTVDFQGPSNFGASYCWIALYPILKESHHDSYQFFLRIGKESASGMAIGSMLKGKGTDQKELVSSYKQALNAMERVKENVIKNNMEEKNYFKFSPGSQAVEWERFYNEGILALDCTDLPIHDISNYNSNEELNEVCGFEPNSSNNTWNLWLLKSAKVGDIVFAAKGRNICLGIGFISGEYYYDNSELKYKHKRKVNWVIKEVYKYSENEFPGYTYLFRADTFSPTKIGHFILSHYAQKYPELKKYFDETITPVLPPQEPCNYWWLNANPGIWSISKHGEGELQTYTTHNERGNKRRVYKYFEEVKKGDLLIGYESSPTKQIKAIYEITKPISKIGGEESIEFRMVEKLEIPVHWHELKSNPKLEKCEVFINNQGSLFKLSEEEYDIISEVIDNKNIVEQKKIDVKKYNFIEDPEKPFLSESRFEDIVNLLKRKKNIILQGSPGVGKTFLAKRIAYQLMGMEDDNKIQLVQFHQSYSYEDFIQGIRPNENGSYAIKNGIFFSFCRRAENHPEKEFFFIIDEINRGNLSKIFGEMMMLLEPDKRNDKYAVRLTYSDDGEKFHIPDNVYLIGTMNTADRSLAMVDYALRRRFAFVNIEPEFGDQFAKYLSDSKVGQHIIDQILDFVEKANSEIKKDINLGSGFCIGHSYFCQLKDDPSDKCLNDILRYEIKPFLEEIWFDDPEKVTKFFKNTEQF
jgi:5-methylcytosine-specific restriction protein B